MRLDFDCIRDILLSVEESTDSSRMWGYSPEDHATHTRLAGYSVDQVLYHLRQCGQHGFFASSNWFSDDNCLVSDLSPAGHSFLADIRSDTNWEKTKKVATDVGSSSLGALKDIASKVIAELVLGQFRG